MQIEVYFVFKFDKQDRELTLTRDRLGTPPYFAYDHEDIAIMSEEEAVNLADKYDAAVGSTIVTAKF